MYKKTDCYISDDHHHDGEQTDDLPVYVSLEKINLYRLTAVFTVFTVFTPDHLCVFLF